MELFLFMISYWESYVFEIPYIISAIWIYRTLGQSIPRAFGYYLQRGRCFGLFFCWAL